MSRVITKKIRCLDKNEAKRLYKYLKKNVEWDDGIRSKTGFTRKGYMFSYEDPIFQEILPEILLILDSFSIPPTAMRGVYGNYYRDGNDWTPNHTHKDTNQIVLSLGATRTLTVGQKEYKMKSGQVILFGSSIHGIPKETDIKRGRISIAIFLAKN